jgi:hypothetical protein
LSWESHNRRAIVRWWHSYPERFPYGRPDPTINLEALPKPSSRTLFGLYRCRRVLDAERYWASDVLLTKLLARMHREHPQMATAVDDVFTGQHASLSVLDMWQSSEDPAHQHSALLISAAIDWTLDRVPRKWTLRIRDEADPVDHQGKPKYEVVTESCYLRVPLESDKEPDYVNVYSPREIQRAKREMAREMHGDYMREAEAQGYKGRSANRRAVQWTAAAMHYSEKEIYRILREVER